MLFERGRGVADVADTSSMARSGGEEMLLTGKNDILTVKFHEQATPKMYVRNRLGKYPSTQYYMGEIDGFDTR
jgi:hypothetical protein